MTGVSNLPAVTIMIPTYQQMDVVARAIDSALAQTYLNLKVIVADDASTDDTWRVAERYDHDSRFRYVRNETRLGRVGNYRHTLFLKATGQWALNLDGDDYLTDDRFIEAAIAAADSPDVVMIVAGYRLVGAAGIVREYVPTRARIETLDGSEFFLRPFGKWLAPHLSTLYRRDLAVQAGFYSQDIVSADQESLRRLALHGRVVLIGRTVAAWTLHGGNTGLRMTTADVIANAAAIVGPYDYARTRGLDIAALDLWRDRSLAEYVVSHGPLVEGGGIAEAWSVVQSIRGYRRAYRLSLLKIWFHPRTAAIWALLAAGGNRSFVAVRSWWRRIAWRVLARVG
jgi:glycosyltransferase involved in cell wall biosynthesis